MFARTFVTAMLVLPLMATTLAFREAQACSPLTGFSIHHTFPAADATEVPVDGVVVLVGEGWDSDAATVEVRLGDVVVAGELTMIDPTRYVWRAEAPLEPNSAYTAHITSSPVHDSDVPGELDLQFTTGPAAAPELMSAALASSSVDGFEREFNECVDEAGMGECGSCNEYKVTGVEHRMRLLAQIAAPGGPFAGFHTGRIAFGPDADTLELGATRFEPVEGGNIGLSADLGIAGTWPSDQVCMRPEVEDPRGGIVQGEVSCLDIGEVNQPAVEEPSTGEGESEGDSSGSSGDDGAWEDTKYEGCGCRGDAGGAGNVGSFGLLTLLGLLGLRRRRA
jgi:MYXO-CTERM domain-containing protein